MAVLSQERGVVMAEEREREGGRGRERGRCWLCDCSPATEWGNTLRWTTSWLLRSEPTITLWRRISTSAGHSMQVPNKRRIFFSEILWISLCLLRTFQRFYWLKISFDISDICVVCIFILRTYQCWSDYKTIYLVFFLFMFRIISVA